MFTVKAPDKYVNEPGLLDKKIPWIAALGKRALIIGGRTALEAVRIPLIARLEEEGLSWGIEEFSGYCTTEEIEHYKKTALAREADIIIGVGGGKALDLSKAVGDQLDLPVVTIPTIAATCAAWSALTVLYDDQGRSSGYLPLKSSPKLVLADTRILASAPKRYLAAGIADTWVKWYELGVNVRQESGELDAQIAAQTAKLALDVLERYALQAYETAGSGEATPAFIETVDAIILLAGLAGSVTGSTARSGIAHSIHNRLTHLPETRGTLHGEKVAFALLAQVILEGRETEEIQQLALALRQFDLPLTLEALGIGQEPSAIAQEVAQGVNIREEAAARLRFSTDASALAHAIQTAHLEGKRVGQEQISTIG